MKTREIAFTALFVALIAACAQITIPTPLVPFTLQVFAISLIAHLFTPKQALRIVFIYLIMGLVGFPIFANAGGGPQTVLSPSFGFLLGFLPLAYFISKANGNIPTILLTYAGFYIFSLTVLYLNLRFMLDITMPLTKLITAYWLTFIPTDTISMIGGYILGKRLKRILHINKQERIS